MKRLMYTMIITIIFISLASCSRHKKAEDEQTSDSDSNLLTLSIVTIEDDYFMAENPWPSPNQFKVLEKLDDKYCEGDIIDVYYKEMNEIDTNYYEVTVNKIEASDFKLDPNKCYKPVIYLYPAKKERISVSLDFSGVLTGTNPEYKDGWDVIAYPDGTLVDDSGREYPYLFWEGESDMQYDMTKGFCIQGNQSEAFLSDKLSYMGLNEQEQKDFMEFWVPFLEKNPYNKICFQSDCYTDNARLNVSPTPDSILRIYMVFQPLKEYVEIEEQELNQFDRQGFTLVEWGGSIVR
ncbi:MAG TPA: hypothetical protein VN258_09885 [Mobilitalea sp.]|nr:hypothetical protein [Mobilitalea sp.]